MNLGPVWVTAVVVAVAMLVSGCGSAVSGTSAPPDVMDAIGVDLCTILNDAELSGLGIRLDTRRPVDEFGVVGCEWLGDSFTLSLERDEQPVEEYVARRDTPAFVTFSENTVNGRAGAQLQVSRSREDCVQLMAGGPVSLSVGVAALMALMTLTGTSPRPVWDWLRTSMTGQLADGSDAPPPQSRVGAEGAMSLASAFRLPKPAPPGGDDPPLGWPETSHETLSRCSRYGRNRNCWGWGAS